MAMTRETGSAWYGSGNSKGKMCWKSINETEFQAYQWVPSSQAIVSHRLWFSRFTPDKIFSVIGIITLLCADKYCKYQRETKPKADRKLFQVDLLRGE